MWFARMMINETHSACINNLQVLPIVEMTVDLIDNTHKTKQNVVRRA